jgi:hypothetical protein
MRLIASRAASALAVVAAFAMTASPALARGWGDRHYRHSRGGVDGGDLLAGLLVIGGIVAIASAASKSTRDQQQEAYRYPGGPDYDSQGGEDGYGDDRSGPVAGEPGNSDWRTSGSMDAAVDQCVGEVERGDRKVGSVDTVNRAEDGYRVDGQMADGRAFTCTVDRDGRIRRLALDGQAVI